MYDPDRRVHYPAQVGVESAAAIVENGRGDWSVWLSPDVTVPELGALMLGLKQIDRAVTAEHMGGGVFALLPLKSGQQPPTGQDLAKIFERPLAKLPTLVCC